MVLRFFTILFVSAALIVSTFGADPVPPVAAAPSYHKEAKVVVDTHSGVRTLFFTMTLDSPNKKIRITEARAYNPQGDLLGGEYIEEIDCILEHRYLRREGPIIVLGDMEHMKLQETGKAGGEGEIPVDNSISVVRVPESGGLSIETWARTPNKKEMGLSGLPAYERIVGPRASPKIWKIWDVLSADPSKGPPGHAVGDADIPIHTTLNVTKTQNPEPSAVEASKPAPNNEQSAASMLAAYERVAGPRVNPRSWKTWDLPSADPDKNPPSRDYSEYLLLYGVPCHAPLRGVGRDETTLLSEQVTDPNRPHVFETPKTTKIPGKPSPGGGILPGPSSSQ